MFEKERCLASFKCRVCGQECENVKDLQEHKKEKHSTEEVFKCGECERVFRSESKLAEHAATHKKYECDECDKIFRYESLLDKHVDAVHVDKVLFCHYYNNNKDCPFDDVCIFEHDESPQCKYGKGCERKMCMYTHDDKDDDSDESSDDEIGDAAVENLKPVLEKVKKAVEKCDSLIDQCSFKCKLCGFEAKDKNGLTMHTKAKHTTKAN